MSTETKKMTVDEFLALPDREKDALVAGTFRLPFAITTFTGDFEGQPGKHLPYSSDISAAWAVVDKMRAMGWDVSICGDNGWGCTFYTITEGHEKYIGPINSATAPLAICLTALKAVGVIE